ALRRQFGGVVGIARVATGHTVDAEVRGGEDLLTGVTAEVIHTAPGPAARYGSIMPPLSCPRVHRGDPGERQESVRRQRARIVQDGAQAISGTVRETKVRRVNAVP